MFWKRNQSTTETFTYRTADRRAFFRVPPSEDEPISLRFGEKEVRVADIGAGGLSFKNDDFRIGESAPVSFDLPGNYPNISVDLKIIEIDQNNICHCSFEGIEEDAVEEIHQYALTRQKSIVTADRKKSKKKRF